MRTPGTGLTFVSVILLAMLFSTLSLCRSVLAGTPTFDRAEAIRRIGLRDGEAPSYARAT